MIKHEERLSAICEPVANTVRDIAEDAAQKLKRDIIVIFGARTPQEQEILYAQGRTSPGNIVTNAKPGQSAHEFNCAADIWIMDATGTKIDWKNAEFADLIKDNISKRTDITWGGDFQSIKDYPHIELKDWRRFKNQRPDTQTNINT